MNKGKLKTVTLISNIIRKGSQGAKDNCGNSEPPKIVHLGLTGSKKGLLLTEQEGEQPETWAHTYPLFVKYLAAALLLAILPAGDI